MPKTGTIKTLAAISTRNSSSSSNDSSSTDSSSTDSSSTDSSSTDSSSTDLSSTVENSDQPVALHLADSTNEDSRGADDLHPVDLFFQQGNSSKNFYRELENLPCKRRRVQKKPFSP
jgi:hypothetical protein